jgi:hypothetical protein
MTLPFKIFVFLCFFFVRKCVENISHSSAVIVDNIFFCSTLSEFENFLLCERILINVTTCQNETSS